MLEKRMKELEKKISVLEQWNSSLENKVEYLQGEVQELKNELTLKVNKSAVKLTVDSLCDQICIEGKEISPNTAVTVNEDEIVTKVGNSVVKQNKESLLIISDQIQITGL